MKRNLILSAILFLVIAKPTGAAGGITNPDTQISYTQAQTITLPYDFEPIDFSGTEAEELDVDLVSIPFINQIGSIALTLFSILDQFQILGIFVVILLAVGAMFWLWRLVTETPSKVSLKVFDAAEVGAEMYDAHLDAQQVGAERKARLSDDRSYTDQLNRRRQSVTTFRKVSRSLKRGLR